jgi:hypothetical protein
MHASLCETLILRLTSAGKYVYYSLSTLFANPADGAQTAAGSSNVATTADLLFMQLQSGQDPHEKNIRVVQN